MTSTQQLRTAREQAAFFAARGMRAVMATAEAGLRAAVDADDRDPAEVPDL